MKKIIMISDKKEILFKIQHFCVLALCVFVGICILIYPERAEESIRNGLSVCGENVIASLFPFLFLSSFIIESGILDRKSRVLSSISKKVFGISYEGIAVFILSAVGGFPVGARMSKKLYENKKIGKETAKRLIFSCVNPSPSFAVTAVGISVFGSSKTGLMIYSSVVISNLLLFFLSDFIFEKEEAVSISDAHERIKLSQAFVGAGKNASEAMISICCNVLLFSCFCDMIGCLTDNQNLINTLCGLLEVTAGCNRFSSVGSIPVIAGIIGWGGLSVHFQIMDCIEKSGLDLKLFFASRAACAFLCVLICDALLRLFPDVTDALALRSDIIIKQTEKSIPLSIMMLLACFIFLIGDYTLGKQTSKTQNS